RPSAQEFTQTLHSVCADLARALVADAEGASHDIRLTVTGAHTEAAAEVVARTVSRSNLFKTAIFGNDPNWGRILAEVGTVPEEVAAFDPDDLDVTINGIMVCRGGGGHELRERVNLAAHREVQVLIDLGAGAAEATIWTNDLTHDYIHENIAYSTWTPLRNRRPQRSSKRCPGSRTSPTRSSTSKSVATRWSTRILSGRSPKTSGSSDTPDSNPSSCTEAAPRSTT